jgi:hypothetical protein
MEVVLQIRSVRTAHEHCLRLPAPPISRTPSAEQKPPLRQPADFIGVAMDGQPINQHIFAIVLRRTSQKWPGLGH